MSAEHARDIMLMSILMLIDMEPKSDKSLSISLGAHEIYFIIKTVLACACAALGHALIYVT